MSSRSNRRQWMKSAAIAGAAGVAARHAGVVLSTAQAADDAATADALIAGKDRRLIVYKALPSEMETPGELLAEHDLTPKELLFVRNNGRFAEAQSLEPSSAEDWKVELGGLVEFPRSIDLKQLRELPAVERTMVLQCSGNGRKFFSEAAPCPGSPWQLGAVANVCFGGVSLKSVVEKLQVNVDPRARFVTAEGRDDPAKPDAADFEHSLPIDDVLERSLLSLTLNGEPLPAVHGGPVRLVTPGFYGTMHVKWLTRLRFEAVETANHHQVRRYRTPLKTLKPGSEFEYGLDNSEPNWRMRIKSLVFAPADGAQVKAGQVLFQGAAFNDGSCAIERVEISLDGDVWQLADLHPPKDPCAWYPWRAKLDLTAGEHAVRVRAVDAQGRTQPLDGSVFWNPAGYCWNGVHQVRVVAT